MLLECNVWCSENIQNRDLGLPDDDVWMAITIKLDAILTIKEAGPNELLGEGRATIYIGNEHFIIDKTYIEVLELWRKHLNGGQ